MAIDPEPESSGVQLRDIYWEALQRSDETSRNAYLDEACAGDLGLRRQVESLLAAHVKVPRDVLTESVLGEALDDGGDKSGDTIGRYRLIEIIGEGGFGVVWRAEQTEPVKRQVALKIIKLGMDTRQVIARFEAERQALAMLDHLNIAKVFDAGATDSGRPYFVMDLIKGDSITEYCDQRNLPVDQRLDLFIQVCEAVQHAHSRGIVHRDLKPSNVVVVEENSKPLAKVIDFGIAKSMQGRLTDKTLFTRREVLLGTPVYMSPEQLNLDADTVDARSDIYSLGVLLYELIAGAPPFERDVLRKAAFGEVQRILCEVEPPKPSTRLERLGSKTTEVAKRRAVEPAALQRLLSGDLDWVVMRTLEKEPERRYATAAALADDLQRHLRNETVSAGPPSVSYRLGKLSQRHRGALASAAVIVVILVVAVGFGVRQSRLSEERIREAEKRATSAVAEPLDEDEVSDWAQYITGIANVQSEAALSPDETMLAYVNWMGPNGDIYIHDLETGAIRNLTQSEKYAPGKYEFCPVYFVWSPDSKWIAYLWFGGPETDPSLRLVAARTGEIKVLKPYDSEWTYTPVDWTPDGQQVLCEVERSARTEALVLVSLDTGADREVMKIEGARPEHIRVSPQGRYLAYALRAKPEQKNAQRDIYLFDLQTSQVSQLTTWSGDDSAPIWAPNDPVVLYSSDKLGDWDLWAVRVESRRPVPPPVTIFYGIGDNAKRLTKSGRLLIHRQVKANKGYSIPPTGPGRTMIWEEGEEEPTAAALSGLVYFNLGGKLHSMSPDGSNKTMLPANVGGEPSYALHGGHQWFLQIREVPGQPYPSGKSRKELFAVREDGDENFTVQLTDHPEREPTEAIRWATDRETRVHDGIVSWCSRVWDRTTTNVTAGIYAARILFSESGNVMRLSRRPDQPLVNDARSHDWSPLGDKLVHCIRGELSILDLNTGQNAPFTSGSDPVWSPDGTRIAFRRSTKSIHILTVDGSDLKALVAAIEYEEVLKSGTFERPVWSPDSTNILFFHHDPIKYQGDIYRIPVTGGEPHNLTLDVDYARPVAWRSQGK